MQKHLAQLSEIKLIGLKIRTNNQDEMDPSKSKIGPLAGSYWSNDTASVFQHRSSAGMTYSVYTEYESDETGEYTYFIGEQVDSFEGQDLEAFATLTIPASDYAKFTTEPGAMPDVVISAWMKIWKMTDADFGGKRKYIADFEVYDHRAADPTNAVLDVYVGVEV